MKPCHENNGAANYVGRAATGHEYLNRNVSIGQLLQHISQNLLWFLHRQGQTRITKTYNK